MAFRPNLLCCSRRLPGIGAWSCSVYSVSHVMCRHKCGFHKFAHDTQLRKSPLPCVFQLLTCRLEYCSKEVKLRMACNKLWLNDDKTEAMTVGTRFRSSVSCGEHLKVCDYADYTEWSMIPACPSLMCFFVFLFLFF